MGGTYTRADRKSNLPELYNRLVDRDAGNAARAATQIRWTQYDGSEPSVNGSTARTNQPTFLLRQTGGRHRRTLLAATDPSGTLDASNCVELVDDAFVGVGAGKQLRLYGPLGTSYAQLTGDNNGLLSLGGTGVNAGVLAVARLLATTSVEVGSGQATVGALRLTNNTGAYTRNAANTADVQTVLVDASNIVTLGDAVNSPTAQMQALTNAILKIGAVNVVTATASLLSSTVSVAIGATPASAGALRLTNNTALNFRNAAASADVSGLSVDSSNNVLLGDGVNSPTAYLRALTNVILRIGAADELTVTASSITAALSLLFTPDGTVDIGAAAATRARNLYLAGAVRPGSATYGFSVPVDQATVATGDANRKTVGPGFQILIVVNNSTGAMCCAMCEGGANVVVKAFETSAGPFEYNTHAAVDVAIYHDGTNYAVSNRTGGNQVLTVMKLGV